MWIVVSSSFIIFPNTFTHADYIAKPESKKQSILNYIWKWFAKVDDDADYVDDDDERLHADDAIDEEYEGN